LSLLIGNGSGGFSPRTLSVPVANYPGWVAVDDFNGDGEPDLALGADSTLASSIWLNHFTTTASGSLTGVNIAGPSNHNVLSTFSGNTVYAASTSTALS